MDLPTYYLLYGPLFDGPTYLLQILTQYYEDLLDPITPLVARCLGKMPSALLVCLPFCLLCPGTGNRLAQVALTLPSCK